MTALHGALSPNGGVKLAHVATVLNGGTPRADDVNWNGDLPFVTPPDLRGLDGDSIVETSRSLTELGASSGSTVAVSGLAVSCRAPIGYVGRLSRRSAFNQGCKAVVPSPAVDEKYLAYVLVAARPILEALGRGTTFMEISASDLGSLLVPATGREEQRRVADYLDRETATIDALIEKQRLLATTLSERRSSTVDRAFDGVDAAQSPLGLNVRMQSGLTLGGKNDSAASESLPYLRVANIQAGRLDLSHVTNVQVSPSVARRHSLQPGDVLITEGGDKAALGRGALWSGEISPCLHQNHVFCLRPNKLKLLPDYLVWVLESRAAREYFEKTRRQTTNLSSTNSQTVRRFKFPLPPLDEQREIADHLDRETAKIDALIAKAERFIELAQERRAALITAAVTGRIEIPTED